MATSTLPRGNQMDWRDTALLVDEVVVDRIIAEDTLTMGGVSLGGYAIKAQEVTFTETAGAGTYTGIVVVPANSYLIDIIVHGVAVWDNAGAVDMDVGITGTATAYFDITSLKAAGDLVAGESISFGTGNNGGETGTLSATGNARYSSSARNVTGIITTASTGGSTGRTRMLVIWAEPTSEASATVATKVTA